MKQSLLFIFAIVLQLNLNAQNGEEHFKTVCASCHTIGKGLLVGPDLKGVHKKHPEKWLLKWVKSSQTLVNEGDKKAVELFNQYNQIPMPDNPQFSDADIKAIITYIKTESGDTEEKTASNETTVISDPTGSNPPAGTTEEKQAENINPSTAPVASEPQKSSMPEATSSNKNTLVNAVSEKLTESSNTFIYTAMGLGATFFLSVLILLAMSVKTLSRELKKQQEK